MASQWLPEDHEPHRELQQAAPRTIEDHSGLRELPNGRTLALCLDSRSKDHAFHRLPREIQETQWCALIGKHSHDEISAARILLKPRHPKTNACAKSPREFGLVGDDGLEPSTSTLSVSRSNQAELIARSPRIVHNFPLRVTALG